MLVTVLNLVNDSVAAIVIGKSEGALDEEIYFETNKKILRVIRKRIIIIKGSMLELLFLFDFT